MCNPSLVSNSCNQVASQAAKLKAIYSVTIDDNATTTCFLDEWLIGPPLSININPKVEFPSA